MRIAPHREREKYAARLQALEENLVIRFDKELFRFINPKFSKAADIVGGTGGLHASGRWNLMGAQRTGYTALSPETALAEALAHVRYFRLPLSKALPRVLVALRLNARRTLDLRDAEVRKALKISLKTIRTLDWRAQNQRNREASTQAWGWAFGNANFEAVIVPSAAHAGGANALVYPENLRGDSRFEVESEIQWREA